MKENRTEILITACFVQEWHEHMNRSVCVSNFYLHGCIFVLEDSAFESWKYSYLNNLPIIRLFFLIQVNCPCLSGWLMRWLLAAKWCKHEPEHFNFLPRYSYFNFLFLQLFFFFFSAIVLTVCHYPLKIKRDWFICIHNDSVIHKRSGLVFGKENNLSSWNYSSFL